MLLNSIKYVFFVDYMDSLAVRGTSWIKINVQVYFFLDTFNNQEQFATMCSTGKSISYRMAVIYFYKLTLQQYLFAHVQPVKQDSMERIVKINVLILRMVVTANLNVTVVSQNVTMLMAVNTLSWVCTSTF